MSTRLALLLACAALSCLWFRPADCHSDNGGDGDDQVCPQESHLSEQVPDQVRRAVADGERAFAVRLIKSVFKVGGVRVWVIRTIFTAAEFLILYRTTGNPLH